MKSNDPHRTSPTGGISCEKQRPIPTAGRVVFGTGKEDGNEMKDSEKWIQKIIQKAKQARIVYINVCVVVKKKNNKLKMYP